MGARTGLLAMAGALTMVLCHAALRAQEKTTWDGVYSDAQAQRGEVLWGEKCAACHGADLSGGEGPSLVGPEFGGNWDDLSLGDLAERVRLSMPQDNPQTLTREQVADILALVLKRNQVPAGQADLPAQTENLRTIKFKAKKPA